MRSFVVWSLVLVALVASEVSAQEPKPPKKEIFIMRLPDFMHIYDDGSGTVGYGAGGPSEARFKAGTFDFDKVEKELRAIKTIETKETWGLYSFSFYEGKKVGKEKQFYTDDRKYMTGLFQKGIESRIDKDEGFNRNGAFLLGRVAGVQMVDTWVVESAEHDGKPVLELKGLKITIGNPRDDRNWIEKIDGKEYKAELKTATEYFSNPDEFELMTYLRDKRIIIRGVYSLNGDELRIRRSGSPTTVSGVIWDSKAEQTDGEKPKKIDSKEGVLIVLKRVTK